MRKWVIKIVVISALLLIVAFTNWRVRDQFLQLKFDFLHDNQEVHSKKTIEDKLAQLELLAYKDLDDAYLNYTKSNEAKYKNLVDKLPYYKIKREDLNQRIVGKFRLKEFICEDDYYKKCMLNKQAELICSFNKKIFFKTLELMEELDKLGYNKHGFRIVNGHRHPAFNEKIGGAKLSRHIKGEAVDIIIDDVNNDGYANKADKDIVLDILDRKVIGDEGGIGLYPGTGNVHYDVRGTKARWDSY